MNKPLAINANDFEKEVLDSTKPVIVEFWAAWCGHCRMFAPVLESYANEKADVIKVVAMDVDQERDFTKTAGVKSTPTILLFHNGKKVASNSGAMSKEQLDDWVNTSLKK
jgi:thioredoxin 1